MFTSPSQVLFSIFGINIYCYGIVMAISIAVGILVADIAGTRFFNLKKETIIDLSPYLIIFGILGARLYYCLLDYNFYLRFPTEIIAIRHGGLSIHGAIIGGFIGLLFFAKRHNLSVKKLCDVSSVGLVLGQAIGRWGNFFNSEAYGFPTNLPWKLYIAPQYRHIPYQDCEFYHPTFLYESILDLVIFIILLFVIKNNNLTKDGNLAHVYLLLYSIVRIVAEYFRIDSISYIIGIPIPIIVSVFIIALSLVMLYYNNIDRIKKGF